MRAATAAVAVAACLPTTTWAQQPATPAPATIVPTPAPPAPTPVPPAPTPVPPAPTPSPIVVPAGYDGAVGAWCPYENSQCGSKSFEGCFAVCSADDSCWAVMLQGGGANCSSDTYGSYWQFCVGYNATDNATHGERYSQSDSNCLWCKEGRCGANRTARVPEPTPAPATRAPTPAPPVPTPSPIVVPSGYDNATGAWCPYENRGCGSQSFEGCFAACSADDSCWAVMLQSGGAGCSSDMYGPFWQLCGGYNATDNATHGERYSESDSNCLWCKEGLCGAAPSRAVRARGPAATYEAIVAGTCAAAGLHDVAQDECRDKAAPGIGATWGGTFGCSQGCPPGCVRDFVSCSGCLAWYTPGDKSAAVGSDIQRVCRG